MYKEMYDYYLKHQELWNTIAEVLKEEWNKESFKDVTVDTLKRIAIVKMWSFPYPHLGCFCCECNLRAPVIPLCNENCIVDWSPSISCMDGHSLYDSFKTVLYFTTHEFSCYGYKGSDRLDKMISLCHKIAELPFRYQKELEEELKGENENARSRTE